MTKQEKQWFNELTQKRENAVNVLQEEGLIHVFVSHIVDTYRESAHFIYELLQNADDVKATEVRFELTDKGVLFTHNGEMSFSISDPKIERQKGIVAGHINAITTFSLSTKKEDVENKIGKFGIGFKSVFQYTNTPHIYNPPYCFKIEEFMIPREVRYDDNLGEQESTKFWLPFDKTDKKSNEAYREISTKLRTLKNPLLFLKNLVKIKITDGDYKVMFTKQASEIDAPVFDFTVQKMKLNGDTILTFDRNVSIKDKDGNFYNLPITIGYVLEDNKITANQDYSHYFENAWCFFPTKQTTGLKYIINAPFILTPNREALKEDRIENTQLIAKLASLIEQSIQGLKTLGYITEDFFTTLVQPSEVVLIFRPIAEKVIQKLQNGEFIPTRDGNYVNVSNAYVCTESLLFDLLKYDDFKPLRKLTKKASAVLVFPERKLFINPSLYTFFYQHFSAAKVDLNATWLGGQYTKAFLEEMPEEFDILFFKYLSERQTSILGKGQPLWKKSFIPVENGSENFSLVAPIDNNGAPQVFIGGSKLKGRYVVVDYLIKDAEIKALLLNTLKFKTPDELDDFYLSLNKYNTENQIPFEEAVEDLYTAYNLSLTLIPNKVDSFYEKIKQIKFIISVKNADEYEYITPSKLVTYYPTVSLKRFFDNASNINWLDIDKYNNEIINIESFKHFLQKLHIQYNPYYWSLRNDGKKNIIHGLDSFIQKDLSLEDSIYLMETLRYHSAEIKNELIILKNTPWLFNEDGIKKKPTEIPAGKLHSKYPDFAESIHVLLGVLNEVKIDKYAGLDEQEKALLTAILPNLKELSPTEIQLAINEFLRKKKLQKASAKTTSSEEENTTDSTPEEILDNWTKEPLAANKKKFEQESLNGNSIPSIPNNINFWKEDYDKQDRLDNPGGYLTSPIIGTTYKEEFESKKKQQLEKELEVETKRAKLLELANQFEPYSFGWFKTLLELEDNFTSEDRVRKNPLRIIFSKAHLDNENILILSGTPFIPPTIEDIGEISIQLYFGDEKYTIKGEVISPKKQSLNVKLTSLDQLKDINLNEVSQAVVEASSPDFILERLKNAFARLPFEDADNLKNPELLPDDLNFVFGPPGTGKTSYLSWLIGGKNLESIFFCEKEIAPLMLAEKKVLVLTPTNKAADVLVERILNNYGDDYPNWLIRFGQTEKFENEPLFIGDRKLKSWVYGQCTLVTTIARYPYDFFNIERKNNELDEWKLKDFKWDVIIFDEASMINQSALLYAVYYSKQINPNVQFYIGGDPFQIPPIIQFEYPYWSYLPDPAFSSDGKPILDEDGKQMAWKQDGGNIYSFVGLMKDDSFLNPKTEPHDYLVHNLKKQFRSVVPIGALFSHYRYNGLLAHIIGQVKLLKQTSHLYQII